MWYTARVDPEGIISAATDSLAGSDISEARARAVAEQWLAEVAWSAPRHVIGLTHWVPRARAYCVSSNVDPAAVHRGLAAYVRGQESRTALPAADIAKLLKEVPE